MNKRKLSREQEGAILADKFANILEKQKQALAIQRSQDKQNFILLAILASLCGVVITIAIKDYLAQRQQQTYQQQVNEMAGYNYVGY